MNKGKSSAMRAVPPEPPDANDPESDVPESFTYRPELSFNIRIRRYLLENSISFPDLCEAALTEYFERNPLWKRRHLRLPRGKRPRT